MIFGIGTDIVEIARVAKICEKHEDAFIRNILTDAETALMADRKNKAEFLAGRWAAKEAFSKALGTGIRGGCTFTDIEIMPDENGKPSVTHIGPETLETVKKLGIGRIHLSISHEKDYAVAMVVMEESEEKEVRS